jgi:hypothetical protein
MIRAKILLTRPQRATDDKGETNREAGLGGRDREDG